MHSKKPAFWQLCGRAYHARRANAFWGDLNPTPNAYHLKRNFPSLGHPADGAAEPDEAPAPLNNRLPIAATPRSPHQERQDPEEAAEFQTEKPDQGLEAVETDKTEVGDKPEDSAELDEEPAYEIAEKTTDEGDEVAETDLKRDEHHTVARLLGPRKASAVYQHEAEQVALPFPRHAYYRTMQLRLFEHQLQVWIQQKARFQKQR